MKKDGPFLVALFALLCIHAWILGTAITRHAPGPKADAVIQEIVEATPD